MQLCRPFDETMSKGGNFFFYIRLYVFCILSSVERWFLEMVIINFKKKMFETDSFTIDFVFHTRMQ